MAQQKNNTEGAFAVPFSGSPEGEWAVSNQDIRHRMNMSLNSQALKNTNMFLSMNFSSAPPYTIRTGSDDNGDLIFNDRPAGLPRNTERGDPQFNMSGSVSYRSRSESATPPLPQVHKGSPSPPATASW
ncbi:hypothetical protein BH18ACI5_BH18ACI5_00610 [soil metagenome]